MILFGALAMLVILFVVWMRMDLDDGKPWDAKILQENARRDHTWD